MFPCCVTQMISPGGTYGGIPKVPSLSQLQQSGKAEATCTWMLPLFFGPEAQFPVLLKSCISGISGQAGNAGMSKVASTGNMQQIHAMGTYVPPC